MNRTAKLLLMAGGLVGLSWLYFRSQKTDPAPPKSEPTYTVMGKKFIDHDSRYSVQYELIGEDGEVIALCDDPKTDGTGCEKFKTNESYVLLKDDSGRLLIDPTSRSLRLTIESEGIWLGKGDEDKSGGHSEADE